jgi:hypothetical protein
MRPGKDIMTERGRGNQDTIVEVHGADDWGISATAGNDGNRLIGVIDLGCGEIHHVGTGH